MKVANLVPATIGAIGPLTTALVGAPWWATLIGLTLALATTVVQMVFPQDSTDRLAWWTNRHAHQRSAGSPVMGQPQRSQGLAVLA
ncbi:hypothetical protein AB0D91_47265 [Streptomyces canus]|uniref:hypothetical protein n=1 Tax=Streptomyces canus TaxID=58343 RepID=UPI0033F8A66B